MTVRVIKAIGGLSNRLRFIFSHFVKAKENNEQMVVIWEIKGECPGYFEDYFQKIEGITFYKSNTHNYHIQHCSGSPICSPIYSELKLRTDMLEIINNKRSLLNNNYIAIHVRRTDHSNFAKSKNRYTSDEEFVQFIDKQQTVNSSLYVATDNIDSYKFFSIKYNNLIKNNHDDSIYNFNNMIERAPHDRHTSLKDSIIDLYMCVYANSFKGSGWSSFSGLIQTLRSIK